MQTNQTVSTNKIIIFAVFICAAIMTSLFVYYQSRKTENTTTMADNNSVIFTAARDIKPVALYTAPHEKLPKTVFLQHWTLLFFGFTHCTSICPITLEKLNRVYEKLRITHPNLQVVFISLDPERDTPDALNHYVHSFNPLFISATGRIQDLRKLQSQLGIFSMRDKKNSSQKNDYQIQHTSSVLLIDPKGKWAGMFNADMSEDQFVALFQNQIKLLSQHHTYA